MFSQKNIVILKLSCSKLVECVILDSEYFKYAECREFINLTVASQSIKNAALKIQG